MIIQVFSKFHEFSIDGHFFSDIPGFPWFPELVGTLYIIILLSFYHPLPPPPHTHTPTLKQYRVSEI